MTQNNTCRLQFSDPLCRFALTLVQISDNFVQPSDRSSSVPLCSLQKTHTNLTFVQISLFPHESNGDTMLYLSKSIANQKLIGRPYQKHFYPGKELNVHSCILSKQNLLDSRPFVTPTLDHLRCIIRPRSHFLGQREISHLRLSKQNKPFFRSNCAGLLAICDPGSPGGPASSFFVNTSQCPTKVDKAHSVTHFSMVCIQFSTLLKHYFLWEIGEKNTHLSLPLRLLGEFGCSSRVQHHLLSSQTDGLLLDYRGSGFCRPGEQHCFRLD